jgi:flagellar biosynthesis protein FlhB
MPEEAGQERTEEATPRKRQDERERGSVARSVEVNNVAVLLGGLALLYFAAPVAYDGLTGLMRFAFGKAMARPLTTESVQELMGTITLETLGFCAPLVLGLFAIAALASYGQVGWLITTESIAPNLSHLDPLEGLKRLVSLRSVMRVFLSLVKLAIITAVFYVAIRNRVLEFFPLVQARPAGLFEYLCRTTALIGFQACAVLAVIAVVDYGYQRWEHERSMRMTHQEVREEMKRLEGDPLVKSRVRQVQRAMARQRMMQDLPKADVVVTNPTHFAVALQYEAAKMEAPTVIAKGRDRVAEKIREIAAFHGIPFVEDVFLARALYKGVEVGQSIPFTLYQAVARVLSYVYQIRRRRQARYVPLAEAPVLPRRGQAAPAGGA